MRLLPILSCTIRLQACHQQPVCRHLHKLTSGQLNVNCQIVRPQACKHRPIHRCLHESTTSQLQGTIDRYNGITVDIAEEIPLTTSLADFQIQLAVSLEQWRIEKIGAVWFQFPLHYSQFISVAAEAGFKFHHAEHEHCVMKLWLPDRPDATPRFASHQVGVCGVVLRADTNQVLVVQERTTQFTMWKFPGGLADLGENLGDAAVRETFEETGIQTSFASVVAFRQQHEHPMAFGRSDLYFVCRLLPVNYDIVPCIREISKCGWMDIQDLKGHIKTTSITHRIASLMQIGIRHGFDSIDFNAEEMNSVYKDLTYQLYHRPLNVD